MVELNERAIFCCVWQQREIWRRREGWQECVHDWDKRQIDKGARQKSSPTHWAPKDTSHRNRGTHCSCTVTQGHVKVTEGKRERECLGMMTFAALTVCTYLYRKNYYFLQQRWCFQDFLYVHLLDFCLQNTQSANKTSTISVMRCWTVSYAASLLNSDFGFYAYVQILYCSLLLFIYKLFTIVIQFYSIPLDWKLAKIVKITSFIEDIEHIAAEL